MRLNTSTPALFAVSSLFCFGSSLPFFSGRKLVLEPLVRRATYSVVPVDGGPAATEDGSPDATVIKTIIQTPAPVTIVKTDNVTLPPVTNVVVSTKIIEGPKSTQTVLVTITHTPVAKTATTTATKYSIIDVSSPPLTVVIPAPVALSTPSTKSKPAAVPTTSSSSTAPTSSSSISGPSTKTTSATSSTTSASTSNAISNPTSSSTSASVSSEPASSQMSASASIAIITTISSAQPTSFQTTTSSSSGIATTSTPTYDNGQWHTYYPSWSNATGTPTGLSAPTLKARLDTPAEGTNHGIMAALRHLIS